MATLLPDENISSRQIRGYRIFVFSHDPPHPPHVHVRKGKRFSSWDITLMICVDGGGFSSTELAVQRTILEKYRDVIWRNWHAHWNH